MQEKYNWNLTDLFKNKEEFEKSIEKMNQDLKEIQKYKGILCNNSENLYNCYNLYEQLLICYEKVYSYGMFTYHLNMANQEGIKLFKEVENLASEFSTTTSFITPEITFADEKNIK